MSLTLSFSQLDTYRRCPKLYWYRYIEKLPGRLWKSASFGTSIHNALYNFYNVILEKNSTRQVSLFEEESKMPGLSELLSYLDRSWVSGGYATKSEEYARKNDGLRILTEWYEMNKENLGEPMYLETSFKLPLGNVILSGRFDRIDRLENGNAEIIDYKTGMEKDQTGVDEDLQLSIYAKAAEDVLGLKVEKLCLYYIGKNKKIYTVREKASLDEMERTVTAVAERIEKGDWVATPGQFCSYCDYNQICDDAILTK